GVGCGAGVTADGLESLGEGGVIGAETGGVFRECAMDEDRGALFGEGDEFRERCFGDDGDLGRKDGAVTSVGGVEGCAGVGSGAIVAGGGDVLEKAVGNVVEADAGVLEFGGEGGGGNADGVHGAVAEVREGPSPRCAHVSWIL